eukprot:m.384185 g.384185  ORF g.384185 m.384185 type:complete len:69 (-) comp56267_c0_seq7:341-547(-)
MLPHVSEHKKRITRLNTEAAQLEPLRSRAIGLDRNWSAYYLFTADPASIYIESSISPHRLDFLLPYAF